MNNQVLYYRLAGENAVTLTFTNSFNSVNVLLDAPWACTLSKMVGRRMVVEPYYAKSAHEAIMFACYGFLLKEGVPFEECRDIATRMMLDYETYQQNNVAEKVEEDTKEENTEEELLPPNQMRHRYADGVLSVEWNGQLYVDTNVDGDLQERLWKLAEESARLDEEAFLGVATEAWVEQWARDIKKAEAEAE